MTRYVARPRMMDAQAPDCFGQVLMDRSAPLTVMDAPGRDTGLLDAKGNPLYAMPDPIGFRPHE